MPRHQRKRLVTAGDWLVRLDQRALPPLARQVRRLTGGARGSRLVAVVGLACALGATIGAVWIANRRAAPADPGPMVRIGPADGQPVSEYISGSRVRLESLLHDPARATTEVYALVAFTAYLAPDRLTPVVGGVAASWAYLRVPLPRVRTVPVRLAAYRIPADVTARMDAVAAMRDERAARAERRLAGMADDTVEHRAMRERYRAEALAARAEATAFRQHCSCVYGVVIQASPVALSEIGRRPEVRVVDPAPQVRRLDRAIFVPPLPERVTGTGVPGGDGSGRAATGTAVIPSPATGSGSAPGTTRPWPNPTITRDLPTAGTGTGAVPWGPVATGTGDSTGTATARRRAAPAVVPAADSAGGLDHV